MILIIISDFQAPPDEVKNAWVEAAPVQVLAKFLVSTVAMTLPLVLTITERCRGKLVPVIVQNTIMIPKGGGGRLSTMTMTEGRRSALGITSGSWTAMRTMTEGPRSTLSIASRSRTAMRTMAKSTSITGGRGSRVVPVIGHETELQELAHQETTRSQRKTATKKYPHRGG